MEKKTLSTTSKSIHRISKKAKKHKNEIEEIKEKDIKFMYENLEGFGEDCAVDGKFLDTYAKQYKEKRCKDNRAEHEATHSCKTYQMKDGKNEIRILS